jgi:DNA-binding MarR family transcriptional regulator
MSSAKAPSLFDDLPFPGTDKTLCPTCQRLVEPGQSCWRCEQPALARNTDPETSKEAANRVETSNVETLVLLAIQRTGKRGATTKELEKSLGVARVTISPRMKPLARKHLIRQTLEKRDGCFVWVSDIDEGVE